MLNTSLRRALVAACTAAVAAAFATGAQAAAEGYPDTLNIVYVKAPFNLQNMVMHEQKRLEQAFAPYGTTVKWHNIVSGAKQAQAMAAGSIDVSAVMNTASFLMGNAAGSPMVIATGVSHPAATFALVGPQGKTLNVRDLKGKKVAGPRGTVLHQMLVAALAKEGMTIDDVQFISMDPGAALSALLTGKVEAALIAASGVIKAQQAGCNVITTAENLVNVNLVMTASSTFAQQYARALELVVQTHRQTLAWIQAHPQQALAIGAKEHGIGTDQAQTLMQWSNYYDTLTQDDIAALEADQGFLIDNGLMQKRIDVKSLVLPSATR